MKKGTITQKILASITTALIIALLIMGYRLHITNKEYRNAIEIYKLKERASENSYNHYLTRQKDTIRGMQQIITTQKQALEMDLISKKEMKDKYLKQIKVINKLKEEITITSKIGEYSKIEIPKDPEASKGSGKNNIDTSKYMRLPIKMTFHDQYYHLSITASEKNPVIDSLFIPSYPEITMGVRKPGLFKKKENIALYENANPYIFLNSMEAITIKNEKKWWNTDIAKIGAGIVAGALFVGAIP